MFPGLTYTGHVKTTNKASRLCSNCSRGHNNSHLSRRVLKNIQKPYLLTDMHSLCGRVSTKQLNVMSLNYIKEINIQKPINSLGKWQSCFKAITMKQKRARLAIVIKFVMEAQTRNKTLEKRQYWEGRNVFAVNDSHKVEHSKVSVLVIKNSI